MPGSAQGDHFVASSCTGSWLAGSEEGGVQGSAQGDHLLASCIVALLAGDEKVGV